MRIAIAQINVTVGDIAGNAKKIIASAQAAQAAGASLIITPELALCGYPPEDLLFRDDFIAACERALAFICRAELAITLVIGHPIRLGGAHYNAASVIENQQIIATYHKQLLPNYSVFDEKRYFSPGSAPLVFTHLGIKLGILICEDSWQPAPAMAAKQAGAQWLIVLNASPYHMDKHETRIERMRARVLETNTGLIYVNLVGGQDELVFDGTSFVLNAQGMLTHQLAAFVEELSLVTIEAGEMQPIAPPAPLSAEAAVYKALQLGLTDYVNKNGFPGVVLGLSGGIDSALTLAIAVDALGAHRVNAVLMSSEFTSAMSVADAITMAKTLQVHYDTLPIQALFATFCQTLAPVFGQRPFDTTEENLQARIRGTLLMALSNKLGSMVLTTGNKSEMAVGYSTLYGDMAGGFSLLKDVPKTLVYRLARYRNQIAPVIPERIISRPPSAELRSDQTDQDSLPAYEVLDAIMQAYVENDLSRQAIVALGFTAADVDRVTSLIDKNEYKRRQAPVGIKITERGFGKDRRYPITSKLLFDL